MINLKIILQYIKEFFMELFNIKPVEYITLVKKKYTIILPVHIFKELSDKRYTISVTSKSTVQLNKSENGKTVYKGTLKKYMGVVSFNTNNTCDFRYNNLNFDKE